MLADSARRFGLVIAATLAVTACGGSTNKPVDAQDTGTTFPDLGAERDLPADDNPISTDGVADAGAVTAEIGPETSSSWQIVSMPDFLNADIADISTLPTWDNGANSTNSWHETAIGYVLGAVAGERPEFVLVAGDLVNGHWYDDNENRAIFGPCTDVDTDRVSVQNAGDIYYARWRQRFEEHGLTFHAAVGDHDIGDNPWYPNEDKSYLLRTGRGRSSRTFPEAPPAYLTNGSS
jgi:hypothetical protein